MLSTVCCDCRGDLIASAEAGLMEDDWEDHPVEVQERKCRRCGRHLHWWYFLTHQQWQEYE